MEEFVIFHARCSHNPFWFYKVSLLRLDHKPASGYYKDEEKVV